ncbi:hypothetical protein KM043_006902 [Ampulex compressa]|nr:hypothetical protein KM043_006902 [Ampulex compressa]
MGIPIWRTLKKEGQKLTAAKCTDSGFSWIYFRAVGRRIPGGKQRRICGGRNVALTFDEDGLPARQRGMSIQLSEAITDRFVYTVRGLCTAWLESLGFAQALKDDPVGENKLAPTLAIYGRFVSRFLIRKRTTSEPALCAFLKWLARSGGARREEGRLELGSRFCFARRLLD